MHKLSDWIFLSVALLIIATSAVALYHGMVTIAGMPQYQAVVAAMHKTGKASPTTVAGEAPPTCADCASLVDVRYHDRVLNPVPQRVGP